MSWWHFALSLNLKRKGYLGHDFVATVCHGGHHFDSLTGEVNDDKVIVVVTFPFQGHVKIFFRCYIIAVPKGVITMYVLTFGNH